MKGTTRVRVGLWGCSWLPTFGSFGLSPISQAGAGIVVETTGRLNWCSGRSVL